MIKLIRSFALSIVITFALASCSFFGSQNAALKAQPTPSLSDLVKIELTIQTDNAVPFNTVGQIIKYVYNIKNAGATGVPAGTPGNVTVTGATVTCPDVTTIGNKDGTFDANEILTCASAYIVTQDDLNRGSVTNIVTATVSGISSAPVTIAVVTAPPSVLKLIKTASPATYDRVGQIITYTYVITNSGTAPLGPAQFIISDTGISAPINCGDAAATLAPNATLSCTATYTVTQADMGVASVSTNATASGGGLGASQATSVVVTSAAAPQSNPANLTAGSSIKHPVADGEWLWQIARCYGTDPEKVSQANLQLSNPNQISPGTTVTVPNIGSAGKIYGPPCVGTHTVQSGDTWNSIALKYNADPTVLQMVNSNAMAVGSVLKVPLNSASTGGVVTTIPTTIPTGNCVDLTRNVTLAGTPAGKTHFNVCGQTDATGNMKIATIGIRQLPADVATGGLSQDITLPVVDTLTPLNDVNSLLVGDMNYDGNEDFRVAMRSPTGPNIPFLYYIYDPATRKFIYNEIYGSITSPEFPGNFEIRSKWQKNEGKRWGIDTYKVINNIPTLTQREVWDTIDATQAKHTIKVFNADGTNQVTVDETIPIPAH